MHILVAEDDFTSRTMLAGMLRKEGHTVTAAVDGAEAWEILQRPDAPRLVVLDWIMPEMDGLEVVQRLRSLPTGRPFHVIMLTVRGEKPDIIAGLDAGANDYLAKPFDFGELRARIQVGCRMVEIQDTLADKIAELERALEQIKTLRGIIPICMQCKKIRDDRGYWNQVEVYVRDHTEAEFSHGLCPTCLEKLYADKERKKNAGP